ncbi:hypothetical protein B0H17DRAFT_1071511 [Mycena rosella]|uniref:NAD(P)-binding domain-containing protein n=1 Tax=Mycena rosella TaxID=1033263 RepID=A0AAD7GBI7_MYCRO|nr:hypothetical protein B0H17DRAFT_1071511 [Mycena rosella]
MRFSSVFKALKNIRFRTPSPFSADGEIFAKERIEKHYTIKALESRGVEYAYVRPTAWHGVAPTGDTRTGHITVDFVNKDGQHVTTQHVYRTDADYN